MGCDIHIKIEKRVDGKWVNVPWTNADERKYSRNHNPAGCVEVPDFFDSRNYDLFSVLAGVRNGTWGDPIPPMDNPRGIPEDSPIGVIGDDPWLGDHSFSYLTLRELQSYPWDSKYKRRAHVTKEQANALKLGKIPNSYAAWSSNGVQVEWDTTIREAVREWPDEVIPMLERLGEPDDVRLVFGFDS